jgi:hypothetical protein
MNELKCVHCKKLIRSLSNSEGKPQATYDCPKFPFALRLASLFQPGRMLTQVAWGCSEALRDCVVCGSQKHIRHLRDMPLCLECKREWDHWCDRQPGIVEYIAPRGHLIQSRWFEKFKLFAESRRQCRVCGCTWAQGCQPPKGPCSWIGWDLCSSCGPREVRHDP